MTNGSHTHHHLKLKIYVCCSLLLLHSNFSSSSFFGLIYLAHWCPLPPLYSHWNNLYDSTLVLLDITSSFYSTELAPPLYPPSLPPLSAFHSSSGVRGPFPFLFLFPLLAHSHRASRLCFFIFILFVFLPLFQPLSTHCLWNIFLSPQSLFLPSSEPPIHI